MPFDRSAYRITTDRLILTVIDEGDTNDVFRTLNFKDTADILSFTKWPMTMEQTAAWCDKAKSGLENENALLFITRNTEEMNPVGCISVHSIEAGQEGGSAEVGSWVAGDCRRKGYANEMLSAVLNFLFGALNLDSVWATAAIDNQGSQKILEQHGFSRVGNKTLQGIEGNDIDCYLYEIKATDPAGQKAL